MERVARKQFKEDAPKIAAFVAESLSRISGSTDIKETAKNTDIVIEAIVENLGVKQKLFSSIDGVRNELERIGCATFIVALF